MVTNEERPITIQRPGTQVAHNQNSCVKSTHSTICTTARNAFTKYRYKGMLLKMFFYLNFFASCTMCVTRPLNHLVVFHKEFVFFDNIPVTSAPGIIALSLFLASILPLLILTFPLQ